MSKLPKGLEAERERLSKAKFDSKVMKKGEQVFMGSLPMLEAERFVRALEGMSGQRCDWCYQGGRMFVMALGDLEQVRWALDHLMPTYQSLQPKYESRYASKD